MGIALMVSVKVPWGLVRRPVRWMCLWRTLPNCSTHHSGAPWDRPRNSPCPATPLAQQQMHNLQQHRGTVTEDRTDLKMTKSAAELLFESDAGKQCLIHNNAGERDIILIFEPDLWYTMGLAMNRGFTTLRSYGLHLFCCSVSRLQFCQLRDHFFMCASLLLASIQAVFCTSLSMKSSNSREIGGLYCL